MNPFEALIQELWHDCSFEDIAGEIHEVSGVDLSRQTIHYWTTGERKPGPETLSKILHNSPTDSRPYQFASRAFRLRWPVVIE